MKTEITQSSSTDVICPHCGYTKNELLEHTDDVHFDGESESLRCPQCRNRFRVDIHVSITYNTSDDEQDCDEEGHEDEGTGTCIYCGESMSELAKYPNEKMKPVVK